jgi:tRNA (guanosine-2'-O-)-methyltransferase
MKKITDALLRDSGDEAKAALTGYLRTFLTPERSARFEEILRQRTRHLTIVLEDIYQPHNASAVLRSCDCFGIQDVHIIENRNKYEVNPDVALGSSKWLTLHKYNRTENNTLACLSELKSRGYRIVCTTPHKDDHTPETLPLGQKTALVFGTELEGLTPEALSMADDFVKIPMFGFTESLNISVSAAVLLHTLTARLYREGDGWRLSEEESSGVLLAWMMSSIKRSDILAADFLKNYKKG